MRRQVREFIKSEGAETLVLGRPVRRGYEQVFSPSGIDEFAADLEQETGVKVMMPELPQEE
jgi:hypothetical protein